MDGSLLCIFLAFQITSGKKDTAFVNCCFRGTGARVTRVDISSSFATVLRSDKVVFSPSVHEIA